MKKFLNVKPRTTTNRAEKKVPEAKASPSPDEKRSPPAEEKKGSQ